MSRRRALLYVLLGMLIGVILLGVIYAAFHWLTHPTNGCPNADTRSTEDAQVFLMGTVGGDFSDPNRDCWREYVVESVLNDLGVTYYNPVVENWTEENAEEEARAIANAETIVLVITENHSSIGSLAESGWTVLSAQERNQNMIIYIAENSDEIDSARARKIVLSQARTLAKQLEVDSLDAVVKLLRAQYE